MTICGSFPGTRRIAGALGGLVFVAGEVIVLAQFRVEKGGGFVGCGLAAEYAADGNRERERKDEGGARLSGGGLHEPREQGFGEAAAMGGVAGKHELVGAGFAMLRASETGLHGANPARIDLSGLAAEEAATRDRDGFRAKHHAGRSSE